MNSIKSSFEDAWRHRFVERGATLHDEAGIAGWTHSGLDARFRRFRALWSDAEPGSASLWLDAGCGAGTYLRYLQVSGREVLGVDYSSPSLAKARALSAGGGHWIAADIKHLPLPSASVDGVLCFGVMQALENPEPAVRELMKVIRPGGACWLDGLNRWCLPTMLREFKRAIRTGRPHLRYDSPWALRRHLLTGGAATVELHWLPLAPARHVWLRWAFEQRLLQWLFAVLPPLGMLLSHSFILVARKSASGGAQRA